MLDEVFPLMISLGTGKALARHFSKNFVGVETCSTDDFLIQV